MLRTGSAFALIPAYERERLKIATGNSWQGRTGYALVTPATVRRSDPTMIPATRGMEGNASAQVLYMTHALIGTIWTVGAARWREGRHVTVQASSDLMPIAANAVSTGPRAGRTSAARTWRHRHRMQSVVAMRHRTA